MLTTDSYCEGKDSMAVDDTNAATSFVMRSSPFQAASPVHERVRDRVHERLQECSFEGWVAEAEGALVSAQQWLPPCDAVPEDDSVFHGSFGLPPDVKPLVHDPDAGNGGPAADNTDADYDEPVQPLQPRTRGLPGNTAPDLSGEDTGTTTDGMEKKLIQPAERKQLFPASPAPGVDGAGTPPPPALPQEASARHYSSLLCDADVTVREAAAAVNLRDLAELRSFRNPPAVVCQVLEAVALLLGMEDCRWAKMWKLLDKEFVAKIRSFDPASTSPAQAERLAVLLQVPTFSDGLLGDRCPAVVALAAWCNAVGRDLEAAPLAPRTSTARLPMPRVRPAPAPAPAPRQVGRGPGSARSSGKPGARPDLGGLEVEPDLWSLSEDELARVPELQVSRAGVGSVTFHGITDCRSLVQRRRLLDIIILNPGEVVVYPNQSSKPSVGVGLNKPASVCLFGCLPKAQGFRDRRARERYKKRVRQMTEDKGAEFVDYDCDEGVWKFRVAHF